MRDWVTLRRGWRIPRRHASEVVVGGFLRRCLTFDFLLYLVEDTLVVAETVVLLPDGVQILLSRWGQHAITMHSIFHEHRCSHWDTFVCFFMGCYPVSESFVHFYAVHSSQGHLMRDLYRNGPIPTNSFIALLPAPMQQAN